MGQVLEGVMRSRSDEGDQTRLGPLSCEGHPSTCVLSNENPCWESLRPVALALRGRRRAGTGAYVCLSLHSWYLTLWTFSPLTLITTYETAEVPRAGVTRPSSHSWVSDSASTDPPPDCSCSCPQRGFPRDRAPSWLHVPVSREPKRAPGKLPEEGM